MSLSGIRPWSNNPLPWWNPPCGCRLGSPAIPCLQPGPRGQAELSGAWGSWGRDNCYQQLERWRWEQEAVAGPSLTQRQEQATAGRPASGTSSPSAFCLLPRHGLGSECISCLPRDHGLGAPFAREPRRREAQERSHWAEAGKGAGRGSGEEGSEGEEEGGERGRDPPAVLQQPGKCGCRRLSPLLSRS